MMRALRVGRRLRVGQRLRPVFCLLGFLIAAGLILWRVAPRREADAMPPVPAEPRVRPPAVMGTFYPADPADLGAAVRGLLKQAEVGPLPGELVALIVPHAGYSYSAPVAAYAYRLLEGKRFDTVAIVGPSHRLPVGGVALSDWDQWFTPLGRVVVDRDGTNAISEADAAARVNNPAYDQEHSIEVQLPFLQATLGEGFKLLPLLMSDFSRSNCSALAKALADCARDKSLLLIASTDMSHYPRYEDAVRVDKETLKAIETFDPVEVEAATRKLMDEGVPNLSTCLCGEGPVKTVLMAARLLGADRVQVLHYANSGDASRGPRESVVGYCAVAIYRTKARQREGELNAEQQQRLLSLARQAIEEHVRAGREVPVTDTDPALLRPAAAFVTLRENGQLRGCIGSLEPDQPLANCVRDRAIMAATGDPRFPSVRPQELPALELEISVLSPLRRVASADNIDISKHGVVVSSGGRHGVFLPQVAKETGWSRDELLSHLCQDKAGLPRDAWKNGAVLYVFTVQAFTSPAPAEKNDVPR